MADAAARRDTALKTVDAFTARTHLGRIIKLGGEGERFLLIKKGRPKAVILSVEDFEDLLDIASEHGDKELQAALRESARQYKRGEVSTLQALKAIYSRSR